MVRVGAFETAAKAMNVAQNNKFNVVEHGQYGSKIIVRNVPYDKALEHIMSKPWKRQIILA